MTERGRLHALWLRWTLAIAAAMVVGGFFAAVFVAARYEARLGFIARETSAVRERLRREEATLAEQAATANHVLALLRDPDTRVFALTGRGPAADARGRVVWKAGEGGYAFVSNLPPPPAGEIYALWSVRGGRSSLAGALRADAAGQILHRLAAGDRVDAFMVTREPAGEAPAPTGPIVLSTP